MQLNPRISDHKSVCCVVCVGVWIYLTPCSSVHPTCACKLYLYVKQSKDRELFLDIWALGVGGKYIKDLNFAVYCYFYPKVWALHLQNVPHY